MKDSGVEWIGEIPEDWRYCKPKHLFSVVSGSGFKPEYQGCPDEEIPVYKACDIARANVFIQGSQNTLSRHNAQQLGFKIIPKESILLPKIGEAMKKNSRAITTVACCIDNNCMALVPKTKTDKYFYYVYSAIDAEWYDNAGTIPSINVGLFINSTLPLPTLPEQQEIAAYLNSRCAEIDKVAEQTRATIEEYKKLKQAIITEAVTKGVRGPRPMKPSGVEWIGDIPEEWSIMKTLWLLEMPITDGPHETPTLYEEGIPFISAEAVSCGRGGIDFSHKRGYISREYYDECCKKYTPRLHDIYMIKSGATTGRVSMVDTEEIFTIWSPLAVLRAAQRKMRPRFLFYSLQADYYQKQISFSWSFGTQQNIGMRVLEQLKIATPDAEEQQEIVAYLDTKCAEIDRIIGKKEQLIEELERYKKSLIYEYVTGKKQVLYK